MNEIDIINRDPKSLNHFIPNGFNDVFAEPAMTRSYDQ